MMDYPKQMQQIYVDPNLQFGELSPILFPSVSNLIKNHTPLYKVHKTAPVGYIVLIII